MCFVVHSSSAQPQIWGYVRGWQYQSPGSPFPNGGLFRLDANGMNPEFVLPLDSNSFRWPGNLMVEAANGKIYAAVTSRSNTNPEPQSNIWEYDPVLDTMQIKYRIENIPFVSFMAGHRSGLAAGPANKLYGLGSRPIVMDPQLGVSIPIYSYDVAANTIQQEASIPGYYHASSVNPWSRKNINGGITVLADGRLMVAEADSEVLTGAIGIADTLTNGYTQAFTMDQFHAPLGYDPNGPFVEVDGLYYSTTRRGAFAFEDIGIFEEHGYGTIFSYDLATNTYTKLHEFTDPNTGYKPSNGLVKHTNGLLYGLAPGGIDLQGFRAGMLYSFDPQTNGYSPLQDFGQTPIGIGTYGYHSQLLSASNGKLYGSVGTGLYEYDPVADTLRFTTGLNLGYGNQSAAQLLELCRKPNYKQRPTSSYTVCNGSYFAYDLRNVNATTVVWRRNGVVVPSQTDQRLEFAAISVGDAGIWSCTMTNECGITEPPPITITVNAGSATAPTITGPTALCGPNGSAVLSGNMAGGTWSSGATSATLTVTQPGLYQVVRTNACGNTYSNILTVERIPILTAPEIGDADGFVHPTDSVLVCPEYPYPLYGNGPGWWNDVPVGTWHTPPSDANNGSTAPDITAEEIGDYYITVSNVCGSDTSARIRCLYIEPWPIASISYTNIFNEPADDLICAGDSVLVTVNFPEPLYTLFTEEFGTVQQMGSAWISDTARYYILAQGPCAGLASDTLRFQLQVDEMPPTTPATILPDVGFAFSGCDGDSTYLSSASPYSIWWWTDADGVQQTDTAQQILIDWTAGGNGFYAMATYNGCGESEWDAVQVQSEPTPEVSYQEASDTLCLTAAPFALSPATPTNGTYSGPGVTGSIFNPAAAGAGAHTITYSFTSGNCTGQDQDVVVVDACLGVAAEVGPVVGFWIHPNPSRGQFTLQLPEQAASATYRVYDGQGRCVLDQQRGQVGANSIDLSALASGTYHMLIDVGGVVQTKEIVIAKE